MGINVADADSESPVDKRLVGRRYFCEKHKSA